MPVLGEDKPFRLPEGTRVELSVPTDQAFVTITAEVARVTETGYGREVLYLDLDEVDTVQRRSDDRFQAKTLTRFKPLDGWEDKANLGIEGIGQGQATDFSLGGMQMLTELDLPEGYEAFFEVRIPGGTLGIKGRVVRRHLSTRLNTTYGIRFLEFDRITSRRLHQFILSQRRKNRDGQGQFGRRRWER